MSEVVGLLSLPNELLIAVFENPKFPVEYLCILAVLCRRLHFLALPIYFRRSGLSDPSKSAVVTLSKDGADMLAALNMALFLSELQDITCVFPHPSCSSIFPLIAHVKRFRKFVSRFPSVRRVTLQLDAQNSMCNSAGDDAALRAWSSSLGGLLNTLVERRCTELTVRYGGYLTRSFALSTTKAPKRMKRTIRAVKRIFLQSRPTLYGKGWEFRRVPEQGRDRALASATPRSSKLTTLHIHSAILVTPPCIAWTLSVLRTSPIASLSVAQISLDKGYWGPVLTLLAKAAGPHLASVSLCNLDDISDEDILKFLGRLPRLKSLEIGTVMETQGISTRWNAHVPQLRALTSLIAPPELVLHLLRAKPAVLPKLTALCIAFQPNLNKTHIRAVATQLADVCQALGPRHSPRISLALTLFSSEIIFDLDALPMMSSHLKECLGRVTSLDLEVFPRSSADVARWVKEVFPTGSAEQVSLNVRTTVAGGEPPDAEFVKAFSETKVKTIVVNGQRYDIRNTKSHAITNV